MISPANACVLCKRVVKCGAFVMKFLQSGIIDMKKIALIGSTGSIGRQTIEVALAHPDEFQIVAMAANGSAQIFEQQINTIKPAYAALADEVAAKAITEVPASTHFEAGKQAALKVASFAEADVVLVAASGFAGLQYSLAAITAKKQLALANKETLVCGGDLVMPTAQKAGVPVLPVDSEHSAIWQCLNFHTQTPFQNLIITASGGAFRGYSKQQLQNVTPEQALAHPTWQMGAKITVDSATLLNKGFEVIEAHHLFGAPFSAIQTVIHPQSIVHSMVEFADGAVLAQLSNPSMLLPIQTALTYPKRIYCPIKQLNFAQKLSLEFLPLERKNYPCYDIALTCGEQGGILPTALNAAGEEAVYAFLAKKIGFLRIGEVLDCVVQQTQNAAVCSFEQLQEVDKKARLLAQAAMQKA
jgi:1-deoxy-D-xylulose-5-phosphate reductoisomerase